MKNLFTDSAGSASAGERLAEGEEKKGAISLRLCVSSIAWDHANLLCKFSCLCNAQSEDWAKVIRNLLIYKVIRCTI